MYTVMSFWSDKIRNDPGIILNYFYASITHFLIISCDHYLQPFLRTCTNHSILNSMEMLSQRTSVVDWLKAPEESPILSWLVWGSLASEDRPEREIGEVRVLNDDVGKTRSTSSSSSSATHYLNSLTDRTAAQISHSLVVYVLYRQQNNITQSHRISQHNDSFVISLAHTEEPACPALRLVGLAQSVYRKR